MREAWKGIQMRTGETKTKACSDGLSQKERKDHCVQLNTFYCRFDEKHNFTVEILLLLLLLLLCTLLVRFPPCPKRITWII